MDEGSPKRTLTKRILTLYTIETYHKFTCTGTQHQKYRSEQVEFESSCSCTPDADGGQLCLVHSALCETEPASQVQNLLRLLLGQAQLTHQP